MAKAKAKTKSVPAEVHLKKSTFSSLHDELDKLVRSISHLTGMAVPRFSMETDFENLLLHPAIDIVDDKESFKVVAELPGMGEDDIQVSISDGMLVIRGSKETSRKDQGKNYMKREIGYGRYERTISLPETVEIEKAKASFKKGMLWVHIPKKAESIKKSRELKIERMDKSK